MKVYVVAYNIRNSNKTGFLGIEAIFEDELEAKRIARIENASHGMYEYFVITEKIHK